MRIVRAVFWATALAATAGGAQAQGVTQGLYVGAGAGLSWLYETNDSVPPPASANLATPSDHFRIRWNPGVVGLASIGWGFANGWRVEVEGSYRHYSAAGSGLVFNRPASGGEATAFGLMANVLYDFGIGRDFVLVPYLGVGIGYAWNRWSGVGGATGTASLSVADTRGAFAYQGIAGIAVPLDRVGVPGLSIGLEYRYVGTTQPAFDGVVRAAGTTTPVRVDPATHNHNLLLTVRYNFGRAVPAPPPPAAPSPVRSFMVFFDFDRADLTARGRDVVLQAAEASRSQPVTRIEVAGHTDTVGTARYNQGLSLRRANTVAAELTRHGVARDAITVAGFGFTRLLVPTGPNVREPQNRRVEIVLR